MPKTEVAAFDEFWIKASIAGAVLLGFLVHDLMMALGWIARGVGTPTIAIEIVITILGSVTIIKIYDLGKVSSGKISPEREGDHD